jgi:lipopolysaccharide transport system ATP-binding protein
MSNIVLKAENISKQYRLGQLGTGTISHDLNRWWYKMRGKEDPYLKIGDANDRSKGGGSDYVWSLKDINFEVKQGDVLGIIGKNGAGKSTLLKILSQVTTPTTGVVKVKGRIASLLEVGTGFHPDLSGRENIFLNGAILGMTKSEIKSKLDEIVDFSGVAKYLDTPVKRYSSGMMVRLGFAVAAHLEPEILIVDEVLAVGDAEFQKKCLGKMKDVSGQGRTVLFVSHQLGMINSLCTRGILLNKGRIEYSSTAAETVNHYLSHLGSNEGNSTTVNLKENPDKKAQLLQLKIYNKEGEAKLTFDVFEQIFIEIQYILREDLAGVGVGLNIERNGEMLGISFDTDEDENRLKTRKKGKYVSVVALPSPLKAGSYNISSIGIGLTNVGGIDSVDHVFNFFVEENSFDPTFKSFSLNRPGVMYTCLNWDTKKIE